MFKELEAKGLMHTSDAEPMHSDYDCVVGVTGPMDTEKYPLLKEELCEFKIVMGKTLPMTVSPFFLLSLVSLLQVSIVDFGGTYSRVGTTITDTK